MTNKQVKDLRNKINNIPASKLELIEIKAAQLREGVTK